MTSIQKQAAELADGWVNSFYPHSDEFGWKMADLLRQIASIGVDVEPAGYLCEWSSGIGMPNDQVFYYGERGSAIEDDWNRHPDVHKNLPLFTHQAIDAARLEAFEAGRRSQQEENQRLLAEVCRLQPLAEQRDAAIARADSAFEDGRRKGLEDAAEICDKQHDQARTPTGAHRADACARRIRELINKEA